MYDSKEIANYFIKKGIDENKPVTPMKLQKLVYFAHGYYLAIYGKSLLDEKIEAWKYGPVIPTLYHKFKEYGNEQIKDIYSKRELRSVHGGILPQKIPTKGIENSKDKKLLDLIWEAYSPLSGIQLSKLTHQDGTPWKETIEQIGGIEHLRKNQDIEDDLIKNHFLNLIDRVQDG